MLKNVTGLEYQIGEKLYHFTCAIDAPITEVKEALAQFLSYATQVSNAPAQAQPVAAAPAAPVAAAEPKPATPEQSS